MPTVKPVDLPSNSANMVTEVAPLTPSGLGPIFTKLAPNPFAGQPQAPCFVGSALTGDMDAINKLLKLPEVNMPKNLRFVWAEKVNKDQETGEETDRINLYAVKMVNGAAPLEGDVITDANADLDQETNQFIVNVNMGGRNDKGASGTQIWARMTAENAPTKRQVAIVLDDRVVSAPAVQSAINDGRTQISGNFSPQEAQDLANILQVGKLPAKTQIIQSDIVGPSLGADNIRTSLTALGIGMLILLGFMAFYYGTGGMIAIVALLLNLLFVVASLASLGTVLTLSGIAGVILTIGMAVDANVIIYERIREEVEKGCSTMGGLKKSTKACTGCGGCTPMVKDLLNAALAAQGVLVRNVICEHFDHTRQEILLGDFELKFGFGHIAQQSILCIRNMSTS